MRKLVSRYLSPLIMTMAIVSLVGNGFNMRTVSAENTFAPPADPNPLLGEWAGRYGGVPPFDKLQAALFKPALEQAMAENLKETDTFTQVLSAPPFEKP